MWILGASICAMVAGFLCIWIGSWAIAYVRRWYMRRKKIQIQLLAKWPWEVPASFRRLLLGLKIIELRASSKRSKSLQQGLCKHVSAGGFIQKYLETTLKGAGLYSWCSVQSLKSYCIRQAVCGFVCGSVLGSLLSYELGLLLAFSFAFLGLVLPLRSLRAERLRRNELLSAELPEFLDLIGMGLSAGLNFDRSLSLYLSLSSGIFAYEMSEKKTRWDLGFCSRQEALQELCLQYDSALLQRICDAVNRSLKLGTAINEPLEALKLEAQKSQKAQLEAFIARLPVKMLIPMGVCILPALLLILIGPVLLELAGGFR